MSQFLFEEFEGVSLEEWKNKVIQDLKGKDFNETLVTNDEIEGISYCPLFHSDDNVKDTYFESANSSFQNIVKVDCSLENSNTIILDSLMNGADGIWFANLNFNNWDVVSKDILFEHIHATFEINEADQAKLLAEQLKSTNPKSVGIICNAEKEILEELNQISNVTFYANGLQYNNSGANISQELAFAACNGIELIYSLKESQSQSKVGILLGSGSNYFQEIAKYRAMRVLWKSICNHLSFDQHTVEIHACTGRINLAVQDHYTNLLRQTTQAMSACIGGADFISVEPYDFISTEKSEKTVRMAKNIPLILKEESYLEKIADASRGSYHIEWLTEKWLSKSTEIIKKIESFGGINTDEAKKFINDSILQTQTLRKEKFEENSIERIGVNLYKNKNLEPLTRNELDYFSYENATNNG